MKYYFICYSLNLERNFFPSSRDIILKRWVKIKEKVKVKACPKGQLITALERLLDEIKKGYLAIGDARIDLPKTVDLKMELEEKDGRVEFELELNWPLHPAKEEKEEARTEETAKAKEQKGEEEKKEGLNLFSGSEANGRKSRD